jgi:hypothetical protein
VPVAQHLAEQFFAGLIDKRDLFQIHDGTRHRRSFAALPPTPAQFFPPSALGIVITSSRAVTALRRPNAARSF